MSDESGRTNDWSDEDLLQRLRRRDPNAIEVLYDRRGRQAFSLAFGILKDGALAEDVVQEAFLRVWRQAERLNPSKGSVTAFLMTVVRRRAIDAYRSRKGMEALNLPLFPELTSQVDADVVDKVMTALGRQTVQEALSALPEDQRQVISLAYFEGFTHVEIAERLTLPLGTVKSRLRLGLDKMRSALASERMSP